MRIDLPTLNPHTPNVFLKIPVLPVGKLLKTHGKSIKDLFRSVHSLPEDFRQFRMYRAFAGETLKMLKIEGLTGQRVFEYLFNTCVEVWYMKEELIVVEKIGAEKRS